MSIRDQAAGLLKDTRVTATLIELERRLGQGAFRIVDHWEADLRAIGIAHPHDDHRLAYIAMGEVDATYFLELETAPAPGSELPYAVMGKFHSVTFDELAMLIAGHLNNAGTDATKTTLI
jgi:hypothetical protein